MTKVGFIGLGKMGSSMAKNLLRNNIQVIACDTNSKRHAEMKTVGAEIVDYPADVAANTHTIITMLPNSSIVKAVFCDSKGILEAISPGTLCIDSSTIEPMMTQNLAKLCSQKQSSFIDAPVSGGVVGAKNATLTFMVGGEIFDFERAKLILKFMGKRIFHCGNIGSGQSVKLCNNMLVGIQMIGVCEAMNVGIKLGLDPKLLASIINVSTGKCWASKACNPVPLAVDGSLSNYEYEGGFASHLMAKDLGIAITAAKASKVSTIFGAQAYEMFQELINKDPSLRDKDFSCIYQMLSKQENK